ISTFALALSNFPSPYVVYVEAVDGSRSSRVGLGACRCRFLAAPSREGRPQGRHVVGKRRSTSSPDSRFSAESIRKSSVRSLSSGSSVASELSPAEQPSTSTRPRRTDRGLRMNSRSTQCSSKTEVHQIRLKAAEKMTDQQLAALNPRTLDVLRAKTHPRSRFGRMLSEEAKELHLRVDRILRTRARLHNRKKCVDDDCVLCPLAPDITESRPSSKRSCVPEPDVQKIYRSSKGFSMTPNCMFDWELPPAFNATFRLVYLCLN